MSVTPTVRSNWTADLDQFLVPDLARSALVLIDVQTDFVDSGASPIAGTTACLPAISKLLDAYRTAGLPVVHVVRLYDGEDVDLVRRGRIAAGAAIVRPGSAGSQIVPQLRPANSDDLDPVRLLAGELQVLGPNEAAMWKPRWSAFHRTGLHQHLSSMGTHTVVFAGCNYPNCPRASITDANSLDYRVLIASDAISGLQDQHLEEAERIGVVHAPTSTIIARLPADRGDSLSSPGQT